MDKSIYDDWSTEYETKNSELDEVENDLIVVNSASTALPLLTIPAGVILSFLWGGLKGYVAAAAAAKSIEAAAAAKAATSAAYATAASAEAAAAEGTATFAVQAEVITTSAAASAATSATILSVISCILFWATIIVAIIAVAYIGFLVYRYFKVNSHGNKLRNELVILKDVEPINPY
jgi:hypothetical protein